MQSNPVSNRSNEPARLNELPRVTPLEQASRMPLLPTSKPRRAARRRGPINPVYLLLLTVLPLAVLAIMVWATASLFPRAAVAPPAQAVITPGNDLASRIDLAYKTDPAGYARTGDIVYVTGQVTNNTGQVVHNVTLKAFLYRGAAGKPEIAGSGIGWAPGDIAPGATAPFTVTAQISGPAPPPLGTPTPAPPPVDRVQVVVDQLWANPTATP